MSTSTTTTSRQANQLAVGDVIVAPDGSHHTVTALDHLGLVRYVKDQGWAW